MVLNLLNVAEAIAALDVTGLEIRDINEIPAEVGLRSPAVLVPLPAYITDFTMERDSYGGGSTAKMTVGYTLNYRLLYAPIGTDRVLTLAIFMDLTEMIGLILDAVLAIDVLDSDFSEVVDIVPLSVINMGIVNDPADRAFYGCDFAFRVSEFVN